MFLIVFFGPS